MFAFVLSIINFVVIGILTLYGKNYLTSYFTEKGKNLASKEDIQEITDKVEKIKSQYLADLERGGWGQACKAAKMWYK